MPIAESRLVRNTISPALSRMVSANISGAGRASGNNGRPIQADAPAGLGVQLFTELTKDFDFEQMKLGGFHATIAMPR